MAAPRRWLLLSVGVCLAWGCSSTEAIRPASLSITSGDGQAAPAHVALAPFVVTLLGSDDAPFAGATISWAISGGSGTLSVTSSVTDAAGQASAVLTLGATYGVVTVEASTPGVPPRIFSATSLDPCDYLVAHTVGASSTGVLSSFDCVLNDGSYIDYYGFSAAAPQGIRLDLTASFDTYLLFYSGTGAIIGSDDDGGDGTNSRIRAILPAGSYQIGANSYSGGVTGPYTLTSTAMSESATGCLEYWVTRNIQSSQSLTATDCVSSGTYGDVFSIFLLAGQPVTISEGSAAFDAYLGLVNSASVVVASDDDSGPGTDAQFTYTPGTTGTYYIVATTYTVGAVGTYALTIQ